MASIGAYIDHIKPSASARFAHGDVELHYETWEPARAASATVYHCHGVCESNETVTVQRLARACVNRGLRLVAMELEGHGLSSGTRGLCGDFDRLVDAFAAFVAARVADTAASPRAGEAHAVSGHSLGATVALYASQTLRRNALFRGCVLLAPAVGVDARAVPPAPVVGLLKLASYVAPEATFGLTPREEPTHYASPPESERNFRGHWPLATSRMLLDVTSRRVTADLAARALKVDFPVYAIHGRKDRVVPLAAVAAFRRDAGLPDSALLAVPLAGHDLLVDPATGPSASQKAAAWLERRFFSAA